MEIHSIEIGMQEIGLEPGETWVKRKVERGWPKTRRKQTEILKPHIRINSTGEKV